MRTKITIILFAVIALAFLMKPVSATDLTYTIYDNQNYDWDFGMFGRENLPGFYILNPTPTGYSFTISVFFSNGDMSVITFPLFLPDINFNNPETGYHYGFIFIQPEITYYDPIYRNPPQFDAIFLRVITTNSGGHITYSQDINKSHFVLSPGVISKIVIVFTESRQPTLTIAIGNVAYWWGGNLWGFWRSESFITKTSFEAAKFDGANIIQDTVRVTIFISHLQDTWTVGTLYDDLGITTTEIFAETLNDAIIMQDPEKLIVTALFSINDDEYTVFVGQDITDASYLHHGLVKNSTEVITSYCDREASWTTYVLAPFTLSIIRRGTLVTVEFIARKYTNINETTVIISTTISSPEISKIGVGADLTTAIYDDTRDPSWLHYYSATIVLANTKITYFTTEFLAGTSPVRRIYLVEIKTRTNIFMYFITHTNPFSFNNKLTDIIDVAGKGTTTDIVTVAANDQRFSIAFVLIMIGATIATFIFTRSISYTLYTFYVMTVVASMFGIQFLPVLADYGVMKYFIYLFALLLASLIFNIVKRRGAAA